MSITWISRKKKRKSRKRKKSITFSELRRNFLRMEDKEILQNVRICYKLWDVDNYPLKIRFQVKDGIWKDKFVGFSMTFVKGYPIFPPIVKCLNEEIVHPFIDLKSKGTIEAIQKEWDPMKKWDPMKTDDFLAFRDVLNSIYCLFDEKNFARFEGECESAKQLFDENKEKFIIYAKELHVNYGIDQFYKDSIAWDKHWFQRTYERRKICSRQIERFLKMKNEKRRRNDIDEYERILFVLENSKMGTIIISEIGKELSIIKCLY